MQCPKCQLENPEQIQFCWRCGKELQNLCPECEFSNPPDFHFCGKCGTKLTQLDSLSDAVPQLEDMSDKLHIPESLRQRMALARQKVKGENRLVTALFADIPGFTRMFQQMTPETVVEQVGSCFAVVTNIVYSYEGYINKFLGDCVLAFFGAPLTHENDAERALLAALDMRKAVSEMGLNISVGINTGMVYFGPIATKQYKEITAYGHDVNLAKRLQETANSGQILIGENTYRFTRNAFDFNPIASLTLKGIESSVVAYEVLNIKEHPEKVRGIDGLRVRMIGREREFTDLKKATDRWIGGQGQAVSIIGEAGIGKSRLASELKAYLERQKDKNAICLEGRCVSTGQPISYLPFLDILRTYFNLSAEDSGPEMARKVSEKITPLFPQNSDEILPFLGNLLSIRFSDELYERLTFSTPEQIRYQTMIWLRDFFAALTQKQPLLLILEDMHWADEQSVDLVLFLMDLLAKTPLMLLCVYRPEREHRVWQLSNLAQRKCLNRYTEITLAPLSNHESLQLVETMLTIDNLPENIKEMILQKSEGNPFFIEEFFRSLIDRDLVYRDGEQLKAREAIFSIEVPATIQSILLARVDQVRPKAKRVLQCASVIGKRFKYRLLKHLMQPEQNFDQYLTEFEERGIICKERTTPELEYAFRHTMMQEATYQSILEKAQRAFHNQVAQGIEQLYQKRLAEHYEELAHHYSRSDSIEKALEYLKKAGDRAVRMSANEEAISHFTKGLELLKQLPDTPERAQQELALLVVLASPIMATKGWSSPELARNSARARDLCQQIGDAPQLLPVLLFFSAFYKFRAELQTARELDEKALDLAQGVQDPGLLLEAHWALGDTLYYLGEYVPARKHLERCIALYNPRRHHPHAFLYGTDPGVASLSLLSSTLWSLGYPDQEQERIYQALTLAQEFSHSFSLGFALLISAMHHMTRREWQIVKERAEKVIALSTEQGFPVWLAMATIVRGKALAEQGQTEKGISQMRQGLVDYQATGAKMIVSKFLAHLAAAYGKIGQTDEGLAVLTEALDMVDDTGECYWEAELYRLKGELLLIKGEVEAKVEDFFMQAIEVARQGQAKSLELRTVMSLSRLWRKQGKIEEARQMLAEIYGWFTEGFDTPDLKDAKALLADLSSN